MIVKDGEIIGRGQNRVLLTGCAVYHAEVTAIMDASARLNPKPLMGSSYYDGIFAIPSSGRLAGRRDEPGENAEGMRDLRERRPCPMCMSAIYWARIDHVFFGASLADATKAGFSDAFQYDDFKKPYESRSIAITPGLEYESRQIA